MALWSARRLGVACVEFTHDSVNRTFGTRESMDDYMDAEGLGRASGAISAFRRSALQICSSIHDTEKKYELR